MKKLMLSVLGGMFLSFSWPSIGHFSFIFFGFIPLLILEDIISKSSIKKKGLVVFGYSFITFLVFNVISTYWIYHATIFGAIMAFLINSLLMSLVFLIFSKSKNILGFRLGYFSFIIFWISMEYLHLNWDLAWPWLIIGNVFANTPNFIQWYEYTGILGGSILVLMINVLLFTYWKHRNFKNLMFSSGIILSCYVISYFLNDNNIIDNKEEGFEVVIVQPNIDPYLDKFSLNYKEQMDIFLNLAKDKVTQKTKLLVGPETALQERIWESEIDSTYSIKRLKSFQKKFPNLSILIGASTYRVFHKNENISSTARKFRDNSGFYDIYNSAIFLSNTNQVKIYHKTKLVPGAEQIPFPYLFNSISAFSVDLGGISGSLGKSNYINTFSTDGYNITPLICYESVFGEMSSFYQSNLLCVITNDGWWKNTAGYKQHFAYSRLRAIEQRKHVVRSANTGISAVVSPFGKVIEKTVWAKKESIVQNIILNNNITFYHEYGDYIGRLSSFVGAILLLLMLVRSKLSPTLH
ncbi:MAG: apolipoprotein N-acyltransferase [Bacteroidota bacterium]|nr:apolipoprotein N-acyltransferase [Bacteroidota bacterium]